MVTGKKQKRNLFLRVTMKLDVEKILLISVQADRGQGGHRRWIKKSRIRETKHLLTDADSSTNTTIWWTKNTQKADFFEK